MTLFSHLGGSLFRPSSWALERSFVSSTVNAKWSNKDMDPVPPHLRTWSTWAYVAYWISDATNLAAWEVASSMLAVGLSWREALSAIFIGNVILAVVMVLNGTIGARLHVSFPIINRPSFGFWFSYFSVISRVILSMFWFGVQTYTGSECVYQMLKALFPSVSRLRNHLPQKAGITSTGLICYIIFWVAQLPFLLVPPQRVRFLFLIKSILVPSAWLAVFAWSVTKVPTSVSLSLAHTTLGGTKLSWAWLNAVNSAIASYCTLCVNIPDFTRYAKNEQAQYIQLIIIPTAFTLCAFFGLAVTSAGQTLYGATIWDPTHLIDRWSNRPAAFFVSFSFAIASLGTNISANSLSAGNDLSAIAPRWINIRRGQVICAVLGGWAFCPWEVLANATGFLSFMNGYAVFLGPFAGIMATDYWLVHKCHVDVPAMYEPHGRYRYYHGINWRAALALLVSVLPNFPGLISSIYPSVKVGRIGHVHDFAWLFGFTTASFVYYAVSVLFPAKETFMEMEILGDMQQQGESKGDDVIVSRGGSSVNRTMKAGS